MAKASGKISSNLLCSANKINFLASSLSLISFLAASLASLTAEIISFLNSIERAFKPSSDLSNNVSANLFISLTNG